MVSLLLDDERSFRDGRDIMVARTVQEAVSLTEGLDELDELWLDYVLRFEDTTDYLRTLSDRAREGRPLKLHKVYIHTSSWGAVDLLKSWLSRLDVNMADVERVLPKEYFDIP
tara:strand:+ start:512 stop:850 length:339 start_codon:yes stop_codon:yes gene_type:complete